MIMEFPKCPENYRKKRREATFRTTPETPVDKINSSYDLGWHFCPDTVLLIPPHWHR
jgi:hypothetical protein